MGSEMCIRDSVYLADHEALAHYLALPYTAVVSHLVREHRPQIVLYGATTTGRDLAPRVASTLRTGLTADCTDLRIGDFTAKGQEYADLLYQIRPAFGGNIIATIVSPEHKPQMATVREGVMVMPEADDDARVRQCQVVAEVVVVGQVHGVGAAGDEGGRKSPDGRARPGQHGADGHAERVGELAGAAEKLEADLGRQAVVLLDDDPDVAAHRGGSRLATVRCRFAAPDDGFAAQPIQGCAPR